MGKLSNSDKQYYHMLNDPIPGLVLRMAVPTVVAMLITVIYNTADTYFVSQINKSASAAVGAVYSIMAIIQAVGYGFGMGAGNLVSLKLGQKDNKKAEMYAATAFFSAFAIGAAVAVVGLSFLRPILQLLGCSDTMLPYAMDYARFILLAAPVSCSSFVLNNTLRAEGDSSKAMWGMCVGGLLNMVLDPIFIFTLGMGTGGAALATAISQCASFLLLGAVFVSGKSIVKIRLRNYTKTPGEIWRIISTGLPTICRQGLGSLASAILILQAVVYGDAAVSAITIANKVYVLIRNVVIGIGQGFQPVAGYNYGAGNTKRTWKAFVFSCAVGTGICLVSAAAVFFFAESIMQWFSKDTDVIRIGTETLYFAAAVVPVMAISTYVNQLYQSLGFRLPATFLASCRQGIFYVPAMFILPIFFDCAGVQAGQPVADFLTFLISVPFLISFYLRIVAPKKEENHGK